MSDLCPRVLAMPNSPKKTRAKVEKMTAQGMTPRQIAGKLGLSTQAIYLHLNAMKREKAS